MTEEAHRECTSDELTNRNVQKEKQLNGEQRVRNWSMHPVN